MNKQRLQELAGIKVNELGINQPNVLFEWDRENGTIEYVKESGLMASLEEEDGGEIWFDVILGSVEPDEQSRFEQNSFEQNSIYLKEKGGDEEDIESLNSLFIFEQDLKKYKIPYHIKYDDEREYCLTVFLIISDFSKIKNFTKEI